MVVARLVHRDHGRGFGGAVALKQLKAADKRGVPWVVVIGPDELAAGRVRLRDLRSGEGQELTLDEAVRRGAAG